MLCYLLGFFNDLEMKLVDLRFSLRGPLVAFNDEDSSDILDVILVENDDEAFRLIPEPTPYGRGTVWSRAIRNLSDAGAGKTLAAVLASQAIKSRFTLQFFT